METQPIGMLPAEKQAAAKLMPMEIRSIATPLEEDQGAANPIPMETQPTGMPPAEKQEAAKPTPMEIQSIVMPPAEKQGAAKLIPVETQSTGMLLGERWGVVNRREFSSVLCVVLSSLSSF